jgi:predicted NUDIX family NTP pyrophosphohydrolase
MPRKQSAGTLLYRRRDGDIELLLVHPSGNYNRRAPWSIPKGLVEDGEALEDCARRETEEETGVRAGVLESIGHIDYTRSQKRIHAYAGPAPDDAQARCASWEVDRVEFVGTERALELIHPEQSPLIERALATLDGQS